MGESSKANRKPPAAEAGDEPVWDSARLNTALEAGGIAFWTWDVQSGEVRWGGYRFGIFEPQRTEGLRGDEAFLQLVYPDDRENVARQIAPSRDRGEPFEVEFRVVETSGRVHWLSAHGQLDAGTTDRPTRLIGVVRDVTKQKNAEKALRLSEERFRRMVDQSPDIIFRVGRRGLEYVSPACWKILGIRPEDQYAESSPLVTRIHPADQAKIPDVVRRLHRGTVRCELRILHADGRTIWTEHSLSPIFTPSGKLFAVEGVVRDISERKHAEEALQRQRREQQIIFDSVPALIWYKDRENRILRANAAAAEAMGLSAADIEGRSTYDLYPEEASQYYRDDLEVIESGVPKLGIVEVMQTTSGEKRWLRTDKIPYRDENSEIIGVIVFAVDITERVQAEEALRQARDELDRRVRERTAELASAVDDLRSEMAERRRAEEKVRRQQEQLAHVQRLRTIEGMASQLAHEINQPLGAIVNFANGLTTRLRKGEVDPEGMSAAAAQIREQGMRAGEVIRRLRGFVRKEAARREYADLNHLVQESARLVEPEAEGNGIVIRFRLEAKAPLTQVDRVQIEQVIVNLLRNAVDSIVETRDGAGEIAIETVLVGEAIQVAIRDTGTGLPAGGDEKLFEPYFTTKPDGLGMGLSISRSIIEAHGGSLWAERNDTRGMTFLFRLPVPGSGETAQDEQDGGVSAAR